MRKKKSILSGYLTFGYLCKKFAICVFGQGSNYEKNMKNGPISTNFRPKSNG
jgi:hypothetical protein